MSSKQERGVTPSGGGWRVQVQVRKQKYTASFKTLPEANGWARELARSRQDGRTPAPPSAFRKAGPGAGENLPVRIDELVKYSLERRTKDRNTKLETERSEFRRWMIVSVFFGNCLVSEIDREMVHRFRDWLAGEREDGSVAPGYARATAKGRLQILKRALEHLYEDRANPAVGVRAKKPRKPMSKVDFAPRQPVTFPQVKAFTAQFRQSNRLPIWLAFVTCLRISEIFGLKIGDWDPAKGTLRVVRQGGNRKQSERALDGDAPMGNPDLPEEGQGTKTPAGQRTLYLPPTLNAFVEQHVLEQHGPTPDDADERAAWLNRQLIVAPTSENPWQVVLTSPWPAALFACGLDFDTLGYHITRHFLRMSGSSWIGLKCSGPEWSRWLGHKLRFEGSLSATTFLHYFQLPDEALMKIADILEEYIQSELEGCLTVDDSWATQGHMTVADAADYLGVAEPTIRRWLIDGTLWRAEGSVEDFKHLFGRIAAGDRIIVAGPALEAARARRLHEASTYCSRQQAARILNVSVEAVRRLLQSGHLEEDEPTSTECRVLLSSIAECQRAMDEQAAQIGPCYGYRETLRILGISGMGLHQRVHDGRIERVRLIGSGADVYTQISVDAESERRGRAA